MREIELWAVESCKRGMCEMYVRVSCERVVLESVRVNCESCQNVY